jgi:tRNA pseudouridine38-40 synthase
MLYYDVDWSKIKDNLEYLKGKHDFSAFCASGSTTDNTVCTVKNVVLENDNENYIFTIEADRFIYKMVRTIVGTLIDIGRGKFEVTLEDIIKKKDRRLAGVTAPPFGLVLEKVDYPGGIE